jgi:hypothetical protein
MILASLARDPAAERLSVRVVSPRRSGSYPGVAANGSADPGSTVVGTCSVPCCANETDLTRRVTRENPTSNSRVAAAAET